VKKVKVSGIRSMEKETASMAFGHDAFRQGSFPDREVAMSKSKTFWILCLAFWRGVMEQWQNPSSP